MVKHTTSTHRLTGATPIQEFKRIGKSSPLKHARSIKAFSSRNEKQTIGDRQSKTSVSRDVSIHLYDRVIATTPTPNYLRFHTENLFATKKESKITTSLAQLRCYTSNSYALGVAGRELRAGACSCWNVRGFGKFWRFEAIRSLQLKVCADELAFSAEDILLTLQV